MQVWMSIFLFLRQYFIISSADHAVDKVQSVSGANAGNVFLALVCDECNND